MVRAPSSHGRQDGQMEVQGFADRRFGPVQRCFAGILAAQP
jgi:hypothetical protein